MKIIQMPASESENFNDDVLSGVIITTFADGGDQVKLVVSNTGGYTPTKSQAARALRRLADMIDANERGSWPLAVT